MAECSKSFLEPLRARFDFTLYHGRNIGAFVRLLNLRACIILVLSLALLPTFGRSQIQLATIYGTIIDPGGALVPASVCRLSIKALD